ncbi:sensor histidine kinase [Streptomyces sp. NPDC051546]|uniref:sensor histidine kinase n=1 Tax=Streptomyces sp. NPDC051546 TaxID=3365655 RepID=UPI0037B78D85
MLLGVVVTSVQHGFVLTSHSFAQEPFAGLKAAILIATPFVLPVAHRFPVPVFLATLPSQFAGGELACLAALYPAALHRSRNGIPILGAALYACTELAADAPASFGIHAAADFLCKMGIALVCLSPVVLKMLNRTRGELAERLAEVEEAHKRESALLTAQVLATERARLAREMHDAIAHQVSLISVQAAALQVTTTDPATQQSARTIRELSATTLAELRHMLGVLRASGGTIDVRSPQPQLADIPQLVADSGLDVTLRIQIPLVGPTAATWSQTVQRTTFRTVQEGLTNVSKHAPGAPIDVHLYEADHHLHVEVRNGPPAPGTMPLDLPASGFGLIGLFERAHLAGGVLTVGPTADGGHLLHAAYPSRELPLPGRQG